jgi:hypothetical protein
MGTIMVNKLQTGIRLPEDMLARIDAFAARMQKEQPGLDVTRAVAMRVLIAKGLETVEQKKTKR